MQPASHDLFGPCAPFGALRGRVHSARYQMQVDAAPQHANHRQAAAPNQHGEHTGHTEDYIHRVGRTGRAEMTGEAFTFVAPEEEGDLRGIERAIGKRLPRVIIPDFDYKATPDTKLEVPRGERLAAMRSQKSTERSRTKAKASRRSEGTTRQSSRSEDPVRRSRPPARSRSSSRPAPSAASRTPSTAPARATSGFGRRVRTPDKRGR